MARILFVLIVMFVIQVLPTTPSIGGEPELVVDNARQPAISLDGIWLGFVTGGNVLRRVALPPIEEPETLLSDVLEFDWGPGNLIVYEALKSDSLWVLDVESETSTFLAVSTGRLATPAWSPLGNEIAVQLEDALAAVSYPQGDVITIPCTGPVNPNCHGQAPTWSPDGLSIAFEDGPDILKGLRSGGVADTVFSPGKGGDSARPSWSPDGKWIAFERDVPGSDTARNIWVIAAEGLGGDLVQVTKGDFQDTDPAWGRDSQAIYFNSNRAATNGVWRIAFMPTAVQPTSWGSIKARFK